MTPSEWWHKRTDGVEGIAKIIGEPGSIWRQHVVWPAGIVLVVVVAVVVARGRKS